MTEIKMYARRRYKARIALLEKKLAGLTGESNQRKKDRTARDIQRAKLLFAVSTLKLEQKAT
jgi:hypothetical protein